MKTLEQILESTKNIGRGGQYGLDACKETILWNIEFFKKSPYQLLEEYVKRANEDAFFNTAMVRGCWEVINNPIE